MMNDFTGNLRALVINPHLEFVGDFLLYTVSLVTASFFGGFVVVMKDCFTSSALVQRCITWRASCLTMPLLGKHDLESLYQEL